jgi:hypothetical protein
MNTKSQQLYKNSTFFKHHSENSITKSRNQIAGQNHNIKIDNKSFKRVEQFKYLGTDLKGIEIPFREKLRAV